MRLRLIAVPLLCFSIPLIEGCSRPDPPVATLGPSPSATAERSNDSSMWASLHPDAGGGLASLLKAEVDKAKQKNLKPVVYIGATWCKPCVAIKKYRRDPMMLDALAGTYIIDLDIDEWKTPDLKPFGFNAGV